jgi:hypothetical protein
MDGVLEYIVTIRTNGNGSLRSQWDDVLLKRDLERLVANGKVREITRAAGIEGKWFLDCETNQIYQYTPAWERGSPRFERLNVDDMLNKFPASEPN